MGARPSSFKRGGGYLNEVDATIVGYQWLVGDTVAIKSGQRKGEDFTPLSLVPEFLVDGEDEPKTQRLLLGDASGYGDVSEDGFVLATPDGQGIGAKSEVGVFLASLVAGGFPEDLFADDPDEIDLQPMIGTRVRLIQEVNPNKKKQVNKKTKKEYDGRDLKVATVHALPSEAPAAGKGKGSKAAPAGKGKAAKGPSIGELAAEALKGILADQPKQTLPKSKVSMAVLRAVKGDNKDAIREFLLDDDNLGSIEGVTYNEKKGTLTLDESDE